MSHYIIIEGPEAAGKSTLVEGVTHYLQSSGVKVVATKNPGATPLGRHLRVLSKTPEFFDKSISLDTLSEQLLMVADNSAYNNIFLPEAMQHDYSVIADRHNLISGMIYGLAGGLSFETLYKLFDVVPQVKADRMFILRINQTDSANRLKIRNSGPDRFEDKGIDYLRKIHFLYDEFLVDPRCWPIIDKIVDRKKVIILDATKSPQELLEAVMHHCQFLTNKPSIVPPVSV